MGITLPDRFEKKLKEANLLFKYEQVSSIVDGYLMDYMGTNITFYTRHGTKHTENIILILDKLLTGKTLNIISAHNLLALLLSAWLHDIGLLNNKKDGKILFEKEIRGQHHITIKEMLIEKEDFREKLGIDDEFLAHAIAEVCYFHNRKAGAVKCAYIPPFLAAVFRVADALDIGSKRAPTIIFRDLVALPAFAEPHWELCKKIKIEINTENDSLSIGFSGISRGDDKNLLKWKFFDLMDEVESVKEILEDTYGKVEFKGYLITENENGVFEETEIKPKEKEEFIGPIEQYILDEYIKKHEENQENIFAARYYSQKAEEMLTFVQELPEDKKEEIKGMAVEKIKRDYTSAIEKLDATLASDEKGLPRYPLRALREWFKLERDLVETKLKHTAEEFCEKVDNNSIDWPWKNYEFNKFYRSMHRIDRAIKSFRSEPRMAPLYLEVLLRTGFSPLEDDIKEEIGKIIEKVNKEGSLHYGCCHCTAEGLIVLSLAGLHDDERWEASAMIIDWFYNLDKEHEFRVIEGKPDGWRKRGFNYTARALLGFVEWLRSSKNIKDIEKKKEYERVKEMLGIILGIFLSEDFSEKIMDGSDVNEWWIYKEIFFALSRLYESKLLDKPGLKYSNKEIKEFILSMEKDRGIMERFEKLSVYDKYDTLYGVVSLIFVEPTLYDRTTIPKFIDGRLDDPVSMRREVGFESPSPLLRLKFSLGWLYALELEHMLEKERGDS